MIAKVDRPKTKTAKAKSATRGQFCDRQTAGHHIAGTLKPGYPRGLVLSLLFGGHPKLAAGEEHREIFRAPDASVAVHLLGSLLDRLG